MHLQNRVVRICRRAVNRRVRRDALGRRPLVPWAPLSLHPFGRNDGDPLPPINADTSAHIDIAATAILVRPSEDVVS